MKTFITILSSLIIIILLSSCSKKAPPDSPIYSKDFKDTLTYIFAYRLAYSGYEFYSIYQNHDKNNMAWNIYPRLGKKIKAEISQQNDKYEIYFENMPYHLVCFYIGKDLNGSFVETKGDDFSSKPKLLLDSDYEFEIPLNFLEIAKQQDDFYMKTIPFIKTELQDFINDYPFKITGPQHFFIAPFTKTIFLHESECGIHIYWREADAILYIAKKGLDDTKLLFDHHFANEHYLFHKYDYMDEKEIQEAALYIRISYCNIDIASCTRDGTLITLCQAPREERPPENFEKYKHLPILNPPRHKISKHQKQTSPDSTP